MQIKTYHADSVHEALRMVRDDLGPDAVVLSTREVRTGGLIGLLNSRRCLELTASIDVPVLGPWLQSIQRLDQGIDLSKWDASNL